MERFERSDQLSTEKLSSQKEKISHEKEQDLYEMLDGQESLAQEAAHEIQQERNELLREILNIDGYDGIDVDGNIPFPESYYRHEFEAFSESMYQLSQKVKRGKDITDLHTDHTDKLIILGYSRHKPSTHYFQALNQFAETHDEQQVEVIYVEIDKAVAGMSAYLHGLIGGQTDNILTFPTVLYRKVGGGITQRMGGYTVRDLERMTEGGRVA